MIIKKIAALTLGLLCANQMLFAQTNAFNVQHTAEQDGFVSATAETGSCQGAGTHYAYQTLHGYRNGSKIAYEETWDNKRNLSILYPVKKGESYSVTIFCSSAEKNLRFLPLNSEVVGAVKAIGFNRTYTANMPGYIIASGYTGSCRGPGSHYTYQKLTGHVNESIRAHEAAWGEWRAVSISYPVSRGETYRIDAYCQPPYNQTNGATAHAFFVELKNVNNAFTSVSQVTPNQIYIAPSDGTLIASGWTGSCKQYGWTNQTLAIFENGIEMIKEQAWGEWRAVSATIPVKAGNSYITQFFCRDSATYANALFIPNAFVFGACKDGLDNDNDGLIDYPEDTGCSGPEDGDERDPDGAACDNGKDDDGDSLIDFPYDPGCESPADTSENEPIRTGCDDGIDNDADGLIDYPGDPGCASPLDPSERDPNGPECDNDKDDDHDGRTDYPQDSECSGPTDDSEAAQRSDCSDGVDNDHDGLTDYPQDPGCASPSDKTEKNYKGPACDDDRDNDRDGKTDYPFDPGCDSPGDTTEYSDGGAACDNGIDDDHDGFIDFPLDTDCDSPNDTSEETCSEKEELHFCRDGIDNDCDGKTDGEDPDCYVNSCPEKACEVRACNSGLPGICATGRQMRICPWWGEWTEWEACKPAHLPGDKPENCWDDVDNDCDGAVDYADSDCQLRGGGSRRGGRNRQRKGLSHQ